MVSPWKTAHEDESCLGSATVMLELARSAVRVSGGMPVPALVHKTAEPLLIAAARKDCGVVAEFVRLAGRDHHLVAACYGADADIVRCVCEADVDALSSIGDRDSDDPLDVRLYSHRLPLCFAAASSHEEAAAEVAAYLMSSDHALDIDNEGRPTADGTVVPSCVYELMSLEIFHTQQVLF